MDEKYYLGFIALFINIKGGVNDKKSIDKLSWKERKDVVHKTKKYDCQEVRDVLLDMALHDRVFTVKKEAYKAA